MDVGMPLKYDTILVTKQSSFSSFSQLLAKMANRIRNDLIFISLIGDKIYKCLKKATVKIALLAGRHND
jgi:hypothetical protein